MRPRTAGLLVVGATALACPAPAAASHSGCEWGAAVDVQPGRPDPVRVRVGPYFWFCPGPVISLRYGPGQAPPPDETGGIQADAPPLHLAVRPRVLRARRVSRIRVRALWIGPPHQAAENVEVRIAGRTVLTGSDGVARLRLRPRRARTLTAVAGEATATLRVLPARRRGQRA